MKFLISEDEKSRILEMHQNATSRQYLTEGDKDDASLSSIINTVANIMNSQIDRKIQENPQFPTTKITVKRSTNETNVWYCWKYGATQIGCNGDISINTLTAGNGPLIVGNSIKNAWQKNPDLPKILKPLPQPKLAATVDKWVAMYRPNPTTPK